MKNTDQLAAEAADRLRDEEGAEFYRDAGIAIIKTAIEKATEILQNRLAATQAELDGADKVIANYKRREAMTEEVRKLWTPDAKAIRAAQRSEQGLLPCPFCGADCDDCRNEEGEGYLGCSNEKCPARKLAMTDEQWNSRAAHASEGQK